MSDRRIAPEEFRDLLDAYCGNTIDDDGLGRLERELLVDPGRRREFVAYFQQHAELTFAIRARQAAGAVLDRMIQEDAQAARPPRRRRAPARLAPGGLPAAAAAGLLTLACLAGLGRLAWQAARTGEPEAAGGAANVAWLVNAQDCEWTGSTSGMPGRDMGAGKVLRLARGLAEMEFECGARVILQGPAELELRSGKEARLVSGTLTARVPPRARGFTVLSPHGKVVDLGTEFGLSVDERGGADLHVFDGKVEAFPLGATPGDEAGVLLLEDQGARIVGHRVDLDPRGDTSRYVRAIVPPPVVVPRSRTFDFARPVAGSLLDRRGLGIGLTHRLPGTGTGLPGLDDNVTLDTARGSLLLTTTRSDLNTQLNMPTGEYLGVRLSDLGFTGGEDFAISATIPEIPGLEYVGQFGLYAGVASDRAIRGGLIGQLEADRYRLFLVNNRDGRDADLNEIGMIDTGDDLRLTLRRAAGAYSLVVENLSRRSSNTLSIAHPTFLDGEREIHVGLFAANPKSDLRRTIKVNQLGVTVWAVEAQAAAAP